MIAHGIVAYVFNTCILRLKRTSLGELILVICSRTYFLYFNLYIYLQESVGGVKHRTTGKQLPRPTSGNAKILILG